MSCFFLPSVRFYMLSEPPWDLQMLFKDWRTSCFQRFFRKITLSQKGRILQEMHFKVTESSAAVHLCDWKNQPVKTGMD